MLIASTTADDKLSYLFTWPSDLPVVPCEQVSVLVRTLPSEFSVDDLLCLHDLPYFLTCLPD